ncbi:hypothetical protein IFM89_003993 [Coptis chinensis]|uniref:Uncharacterized protein n=1 Tax=Coptis chinensis TaxID=261450 RepID=A0A835HW02_9MAGN|nr:hypothetical protein IFM89_003993 [Coptis chinensis]
MASKLHSALLSTILVLTMLLAICQFIAAARESPTSIKNNAKIKPDQDVPLTTQTVPGIEVNLPPVLGAGIPNLNIPGSEYHRYIPGLDDTFIPNPGYEIPLPHGVHPTAAHP